MCEPGSLNVTKHVRVAFVRGSPVACLCWEFHVYVSRVSPARVRDFYLYELRESPRAWWISSEEMTASLPLFSGMKRLSDLGSSVFPSVEPQNVLLHVQRVIQRDSRCAKADGEPQGFCPDFGMLCVRK